MATSYSSILHSQQFTFLVGPSEQPITVHAGAISVLSSPLERLVNGPMKEAQESIARFPNLEVCDFERICEFAYRGDYGVPKPAEIDFDEGDSAEKSGSDREENARSSCTPPRSPLPSWAESPKITEEIKKRMNKNKSTAGLAGLSLSEGKRNAQTGLGRLTIHFTERQYLNGISPSAEISKQFTPVGNTSAFQDFAPVFLGYARIYAFAEQYMVEKLKEITLTKLHCTMVSFTLYISCRPAIMELVRFAYHNDYIPDRGMTGPIDALRELVVEYMAMHVRDMRFCDDHQQFLAEEGEYAMDLMNALHQWRL